MQVLTKLMWYWYINVNEFWFLELADCLYRGMFPRFSCHTAEFSRKVYESYDSFYVKSMKIMHGRMCERI